MVHTPWCTWCLRKVGVLERGCEPLTAGSATAQLSWPSHGISNLLHVSRMYLRLKGTWRAGPGWRPLYVVEKSWPSVSGRRCWVGYPPEAHLLAT